jgi:hypothetical protein
MVSLLKCKTCNSIYSLKNKEFKFLVSIEIPNMFCPCAVTQMQYLYKKYSTAVDSCPYIVDLSNFTDITTELVSILYD